MKRLTDEERIKILDDLSWFYNSIDVDRSIAFGNGDWNSPKKPETKR